jgi:hypothetical protein
MKIASRFILLFLALSIGLSASTFSFRGTFHSDDQVQFFTFNLLSDSTVTLQSLAYGGGTNAASAVIPAGGFDTLFSYYSANTMLIGMQDDSTCGVDPVHNRNGACLDSYTKVFLTAGSYFLALTESGNQPNGNLSDGFSQQGNGNFTCPQGFCDVLGGQNNGTYAVDILNVASASSVAAPEPGTALLFGLSLFLLCAIRFGWRTQHSTHKQLKDLTHEND